ncbi:MAG: peptidase [Magnetococcales bacterium]|nr:peptidase [Magnetococcales bacterium]
MTYCVGITLDKGMVFASDSRTNAGVDQVCAYPKMHLFEWPGERVFILLSSGNLATTQALVRRLHLENSQENITSLKSVPNMMAAADYVGDVSVSIQSKQSGLCQSSANFTASFILGGQIAGAPMEMFLIYPEGNHISPSPYSPFLQIGEIKYGKPILDRIIRPSMNMADACRCALVSIDSTMRSNLSVGPPIDLAIYESEKLSINRRETFAKETGFLRELRSQWAEGLVNLFKNLPKFDWESGDR